MNWRKADIKDYNKILTFYEDMILSMKGRTDTAGWIKDVYPSDAFLKDAIDKEELYLMEEEASILSCVILNSSWNEGYEDCPWSISCERTEILVPHALAVHPDAQGKGIGRKVMEAIIKDAKEAGRRTIRLDILAGNIAAEKLYTSLGFNYVKDKDLFYDDVGWKRFIMYEKVL